MKLFWSRTWKKGLLYYNAKIQRLAFVSSQNEESGNELNEELEVLVKDCFEVIEVEVEGELNRLLTVAVCPYN